MTTRMINGRAHNFQDLTGRRFGKLEVLGLAGKKGRVLMWRVRCDCGKEAEKPGHGMVRGDVQSCGHRCPLWFAYRHGGKNRPEYSVWLGIKKRCYNPNEKRYADWGGRGIKVCDRWLGPDGFANFLVDMGPRPGRDYQIERKDNDRDYEPGNCRWATRVEQGMNKRNNRVITIDGEARVLSAWCRLLGLNSKSIYEQAKRHGRTVDDEIRHLWKQRA